MATTRRINVDLQLIVTAAILSLYGLAVVFSAGHTDVRTVATNAYRAQAVWLVVAIIAAFSVSRASVRLIEWMTVPAYAFTIVLLTALLVGLGSGGGTARSTAGWLTIAGHRLGQPAEFAKLTVVLMLARVLAQNRVAPKSMIELWKPIARGRRCRCSSSWRRATSARRSCSSESFSPCCSGQASRGSCCSCSQARSSV